MAQNANKKARFRLWASLPDDLIDVISSRLNFVDYLAFGGVCTSWRSVSVARREAFMATQPPYLVLVSVYAKRTCSLFNLSDGTICKTMLPNLHGRSLWGFSCGYLIMRDKSSKVWLVNLITREELDFPILPEPFAGFVTHDFRPILVYSSLLSKFVMIVAHRSCRHLLICGVGDVAWTIYSITCWYDDEPWKIVDLAFFEGKIYVLTNKARIGIFKLRAHSIFTLLKIAGTPNISSSSLQLVTSNGELLMVDVCRCDRVYKLDRMKMEWVKVVSLGEQALFLNNFQSGIVSNPSVWGGYSNCIYNTVLNHINTLFMDCRATQSLKFADGEQIGYLRPYFWYFPSQSHIRNVLQEEI